MSSRFRVPKSVEEERSFLSEAVPKNTQYNTKWAVKLFEDWQQHRGNKIGRVETDGLDGVDLDNVEDLTVALEEMSACTVSFWLCKFICEVAKRNGGRYPPKTLYLVVCGLNRYLSDVKGEKAFSVLDKADKR